MNKDLIREDTVLGKNQVIAGSSDKDLVLQTKGKVKIQQGSKFIDLIQNGNIKIPELIYIVDKISDIKDKTGFYYVKENKSLYALVANNLITINGEGINNNNSEKGATKLSELSDVVLINLRDGDLLTYRNGYWVNNLFNLEDLDSIKNKIGSIQKDLEAHKSYTQRTFQDVLETFNMMFDPEGDYFTNEIKPLAVHTAQLIVGTNSQQFNLKNIKFKPNYKGNYNHFVANVIDRSKPGVLVHNTIGLGETTGTVGYTWEILQPLDGTSPDYMYQIQDDAPYYLYAKCSRISNIGEFVISSEAILLEYDPDYYYFWVGVLNSPRASLNSTDQGPTLSEDTVNNSKVRSFQTMYGFTEIAGNQITTGVIKDQTGISYWDMINGAFYLGDPDGSYLYYDSKTKQLKIKGYITQTNPDESIRYVNIYTVSDDKPLTPTFTSIPPAVDWTMTIPKVHNGYLRPPDIINGMSNSNTITFTESGTVNIDMACSTEYNHDFFSITRVNSETILKKMSGEDSFQTTLYVNAGDYVTLTYSKDASGSSGSDTGWILFTGVKYTMSNEYWIYETGFIWMSSAECAGNTVISEKWSEPIKITAADGKDGEAGPGISYVGEYNNDKEYVGTSYIVNVVKYVNAESTENGTFYISKLNPPKSPFKGIDPTNHIDRNKYWVRFGASFESIATGLLFADKANIAGLDFFNKCITSVDKNFYLDGRDNGNVTKYPILSFGEKSVDSQGVPKMESSIRFYGDGTMQVGSGDSTSNSSAGITGKGNTDESIRFWAGKPFDSANTAPFRVLQNGNIYAENADITGNISCTSLKINKKNYTSWFGPGVKGIIHYGEINNVPYSFETIYSTGGFQVYSIEQKNKGIIGIKHTLLENYTVFYSGIVRIPMGDSWTDHEGFRGTSSFICRAGYTEGHFIDTDNNNHSPGDKFTEIDLIFISY